MTLYNTSDQTSYVILQNDKINKDLIISLSVLIIKELKLVTISHLFLHPKKQSKNCCVKMCYTVQCVQNY